MRSALCLALVLVSACAGAPPPPKVASAPRSLEERYDATPKEELTWASFDAQTFARAKAERRFVVMDGSAEWCHWCHVMEAVTYHDPSVAALLRERFIAAKVDVDARPDIEERYSDYGWPATVIFSSDGRELGKFRGFLAPEEFLEILKKVVSDGDGGTRQSIASTPIPDSPLGEEHLKWIARMTALELDDYWDPELGGWGRQQKVAIYVDDAWLIAQSRKGDATASAQLATVLDRQLAITDPVWGGVYQYSTDGDWAHPHYEKLMTFNAGALENYSEAYALTHDARWLSTARATRGYLSRFLKGASGGFYPTQDADLNAHERGKAFLKGHDYYSKTEPERLALGLPRVDTHEYARDNGLAIRAYSVFATAAGDPSALDEASQAADRVLATHADPRGGLTHDSAPSKLLYLADNAAMTWGLLGLWEAKKDDARLAQAVGLADFVLAQLEDKVGGGFFAHTLDDAAVGVFAERIKPEEDGVMMVRALARLAKARPDKALVYRRTIARALRALCTPEAIKARGRFVGDVLLMLDETIGVRTPVD